MERSDAQKARVGVILGGVSAEREVSLATGRAMLDALKGRDYEVAAIDADRDLPEILTAEGIEIAVLALHGRFGEDGCVQGLLEVMRIPYSGSGVLASALAMDKPAAKRAFMADGIPTPPFKVLTGSDGFCGSLGGLGLGPQVVVKPGSEGSSIGIGFCSSDEELTEAVSAAAAYPGEILLEQMVSGREITVGILDGKALGVLEIVPAEKFYDYTAKYRSDETRYLLPAPIPEDVADRARSLAERAHRVLGCSGVTRVDFILDEEEGLHTLELNTLPGLTETSLVPKLAQGAGLSFVDLCERILLGASLKR